MMYEMVKLAYEDFKVVMITVLDEVKDSILGMNERIGNNPRKYKLYKTKWKS